MFVHIKNIHTIPPKNVAEGANILVIIPFFLLSRFDPSMEPIIDWLGPGSARKIQLAVEVDYRKVCVALHADILLPWAHELVSTDSLNEDKYGVPLARPYGVYFCLGGQAPVVWPGPRLPLQPVFCLYARSHTDRQGVKFDLRRLDPDWDQDYRDVIAYNRMINQIFELGHYLR